MIVGWKRGRGQLSTLTHQAATVLSSTLLSAVIRLARTQLSPSVSQSQQLTSQQTQAVQSRHLNSGISASSAAASRAASTPARAAPRARPAHPGSIPPARRAIPGARVAHQLTESARRRGRRRRSSPNARPRVTRRLRGRLASVKCQRPGPGADASISVSQRCNFASSRELKGCRWLLGNVAVG